MEKNTTSAPTPAAGMRPNLSAEEPQTFIWLFWASRKDMPKASPIMYRTAAPDEKTARAGMLDWDLTFAAKIRGTAHFRIDFYDYAGRKGWRFNHVPGRMRTVTGGKIKNSGGAA